MTNPKQKQNKYYERVYLSSTKSSYWINRKGGKYLACLPTLEEALYYRDLYSDTPVGENPDPCTVDLKYENPYIKDGLKYPIPARLKKGNNHKSNPYGVGCINKKSQSSYAVTYNSKYYCSCRTYEQAYYVRQELQKAKWNKKELPRIFNEYPKYYTELLYFYQYISKHTNRDGYYITIPKNKTSTGQIEHLPYTKLTDALHERDFLVEHDWDYELLIECIDDTKNKYDNMKLPPFPERKIRNLQKRKGYKNELKIIGELVKKHPLISITTVAELMHVTATTIRNWLKKYNLNWSEFIVNVTSQEDYIDTLKLKGKIYTPDLEPLPHPNFKGYIHDNKRSKKSPYRVHYNHKDYGSYSNYEQAQKIVADLIACNWDHSQLKEIQARHGFHSIRGSRKNIYLKQNRYRIVKYVNGKQVYFGSYKNHAEAEIIRDKLIECNWDKKRLPEFQIKAKEMIT